MQRLKLKFFEERSITFALINLIINGLYALGNFALGIYEQSYWFITAGAYYGILGAMRFLTVLFARKSKKSLKNELFVQKIVGVMLVLLSFVLSGSVYLCVRFDVSRAIHEIIMITIATYTFTKITFAIINLTRNSKRNSPLLLSLFCINLSDASVSIFSMQRSMLVSFGEMSVGDIKLMNSLTGAAVCILVAVLGVWMTMKSRKEVCDNG